MTRSRCMCGDLGLMLAAGGTLLLMLPSPASKVGVAITGDFVLVGKLIRFLGLIMRSPIRPLGLTRHPGSKQSFTHCFVHMTAPGLNFSLTVGFTLLIRVVRSGTFCCDGFR